MNEPTPAGDGASLVRLAELAAAFGGTLHGEGAADATVRRFAPIDVAGEGDIAFVANPRYRGRLATTGASAVVVRPVDLDAVPPGVAAVAVADPYLWYARAAARLAADEAIAGGIDPRAVVAPDARIGQGARIEAGAVVEAGASVGARARIGAGAVVGRRASIGDDAVLHPRVVVYHDCCVGARTLVHAGAVIGADGFGFARDGDHWVKIPQTGRAIVGDDCEIGANTTIDRGALGDTVIGDGCKLDNQIQVAHNVRIGEGTAIAACVGIAGSATIGRGCMIGGGAGILGHLEVADGTVISAMSLVTRTIARPGFYTGVFPLMPNRDWERAAAGVKRLDALRDRVRALGADGDTPKENDKDPR